MDGGVIHEQEGELDERQVQSGGAQDRSQEYPNTDMSITFLFDISKGTILCRKSKN